MKKMILRMIGSILMGGVGIWLLSSVAFADNPIVQTNYTADPAPMVYNDTVYLYTTHDEDVTVNGFFTMNDWRCYSTKDMVNWTDHGEVFSLEDIRWAKKDAGARAWAAQCIERNGKFYLYVPVLGQGRQQGLPESETPGNNMMIGVGVSDSPTGPFEDLGAPLININTWDEIDPTVFIDDDEQAYLYWGNPVIKYVKLNEDMVSYDKSYGVKTLAMTPEEFGEREGGVEGRHTSSYEEGPWAYKRNDLYYMVYAAGPLPEHLGYATSTSPLGPWTYGGLIMPSGPNTAFTIHPGIVDFKGKSYMFYHNQTLPGGGGFKRSVCVDEFHYGADGSISETTATKEGVSANGSLNPYTRTEAETIAWLANLTRAGEKNSAYYDSLVKTEPCSQGGMNIHNTRNGNYIKVKEVDFGSGGVSSFTASVACGEDSQGGTIQMYIDAPDGEFIGELDVLPTGGWDTWKEVTTEDIADVSGIHDLYFVFTGDGTSNSLMKVDYWQFASFASSVTLSEEQLELKVGEERKLTATVMPDHINTSLKWTSANSNVATVASDGTIKAIAEGTTTITAEVQDGSGKQGTCTVKVIPVNTPTATPMTFSITYELNGGKNNSQNLGIYQKGTTVTLKNPTMPKYEFVGWYSDSGFNNKVTTVTDSSITVYAKWNKVTVSKAKIKTLKNNKSKRVNLVVGKISNAKGYQIQYATNAKFTKGKKSISITKITCNILKLKKGKTYYFKVRAYKRDSEGKIIYGKYSNVKKVKIKK